MGRRWHGKGKRKAAAVAVVLCVATLVALLSAGYVQGGHGYVTQGHTYLIPQGQGSQIAEGQAQNQVRNYVFYWWWLGAGSPANRIMTWTADAAMLSDVSEAFLMWSQAMPQLRFLYTTSTGADVVFKDAQCPGDPGAAGCTLWTVWWGDTDRKAAYWQRAEVYVNPNFTYDTYGKTAVAAHEIGHLIGLHERYLEPEAVPVTFCNSNEQVIMDKKKLNWEGKWYSCDGGHWPTSPDVARATEFWDQGQAEWLPSSASRESGFGWFNWTDHAWSEYTYYVEHLCWNPNTGYWDYINTGWRTAGIGRHAWNFLDVKTEEVARNPTLCNFPGGTWYVASLTPYFFGFDTGGRYGTRTSAPIVWID